MDPLSPSFPPADKAAWRAQVQKDLKDAMAPDNLRWETDLSGTVGNITLEPYYTAEDSAALPLTGIQSAQKQVPGWLNAPQRRFTDSKKDNVVARADLARGANAMVLDLDGNSPNETDLSRLLNGIKLSETPVYFQNTRPVEFVETLQRVAPYQLKGGLLTDPLTQPQPGTSPGNALTAIADATRATADSPQFRTICVSSHVFHNAGATATQELAFLLSSLADQYDTLTDAGLPVDQLVPKTSLSVSVGTSYFVEVAKLRALRVLWQRFLSAYQLPPTLATTPAFIHAQTSTFYDSTRSPYTNLLRATTEAMAAVIGGCDMMTVHAYNAVFAPPTEFSDRVARNVSVLLTEESYLDKVADPSAGSYYIENLTHTVVEAAWALFLRVEAMGGLLKAIEDGFVKTEIDAAYQSKVDALKKDRIMVGVNKFREADEHADQPTKQETPGKSLSGLTTLLPDRRLAGEFEH